MTELEFYQVLCAVLYACAGVINYWLFDLFMSTDDGQEVIDDLADTEGCNDQQIDAVIKVSLFCAAALWPLSFTFFFVASDKSVK